MFFDSWAELGHIALASVLFYVFVVIAVQIGGKRSTSKMNNYDWIVTVALGSIFGSTILSDEIVLLEGFVASAALIGTKYTFTLAACHSKTISKLLRATPRLLVFKGEFLENEMRRERVTKAEIRAAVREKGLPTMDDVWAVVLEADAVLSVISKQDRGLLSILSEVDGVPEEAIV